MKQKPVARETMIVLAAITFDMAVETNAPAAGDRTGGGAQGAGGGFGLFDLAPHKRRFVTRA